MKDAALLLLFVGVWIGFWVLVVRFRRKVNKWLAHLLGAAGGFVFGAASLVPFLPPAPVEKAAAPQQGAAADVVAAVGVAAVEPPPPPAAAPAEPEPIPGLTRTTYEKRMARYLRDFPQCSIVTIEKASIVTQKGAVYDGAGARGFQVVMELKGDKLLEVRAVSAGNFRDQKAMEDMLCLTYATMRTLDPEHTTQKDSLALSGSLLKDAKESPAEADFLDSRMVVQWVPLQVRLLGPAPR